MALRAPLIWMVVVFDFRFLKTDQNSLGMSKIMLANGADNSAIHSF